MQKIKYHVVALALLCIATCGWSQKITPKQQQDLLFEQASDLFRKEKYATAQQLFDQTVQGYSANSSTAANAMYYAAVCAVQLNNNDAQQRLDAFLHRYPQSGHGDMARFYIGNYYYARNKYDKALSYYKKINPQQVEFGHRSEFSFKQGYCYLMAGQLKEAKQLFVQQKDGSSKYTEASLYYYAHIQYADGEYDLALKSFQKLKESDKFAKIVPNYEIRLYYYLGRHDQVLQMAPDMLKDASTYKRNEVCQMVAEIYFNQAAYAEALPYYHAAAQMTDAGSTMPNANDAAVKKTLAPTRSACTPQDNLYQMGYCHYMLHQFDSALFYLQNKTACDDSVAQNAFYTMGDIYLQQGDKDKARSMFLQASQLKHNPSIQEEALFCYAKLSCELNKNPYNESIRSFQNYLKQYPHTTHREEVQEILASLYLTTRNYKDALTLIESITNRNITLNKAYQRILVGYGIELFNKGKIADASSNFDKAVAVAADIKVTCDAYYLLGESYFRLGQNKKAFHALDQFLLSSTASQSPYYTQGLYTQGYLCMQNKDYDDAATHFKSFINIGRQQSAPHQICDAYNRLGDCRFITRHYQEAITNYDYTIKAGDADADYATYQKALSYGAMGDDQNKFASLQKIFELYPQSELKSTALLEMANTYRKLENNEMAIHKYSEFLQTYPNHSQVKDALLSMGLIYYNTSNDAEALATFDQLLQQYPETDESRYALDVIKNIYRDHDSLEYYFEYISQATRISVSTIEQDSSIYMAAEDRYLGGEYDRAAVSMSNYLRKFPNGLFSLKAHYYAADSYQRQGQPDKALPHYLQVCQSARCQWTETSLLTAAGIAYDDSNYVLADSLYAQLADMAENQSNRIIGRLGVLRCCVMLNRESAINAAADALLNEPRIETEHREEALIAKARLSYSQGLKQQVITLYEPLLTSTNGEYSGEAAYRRAECIYQTSGCEPAEKIINDIVQDMASDYWLAKTFILWADIYHNDHHNNLQAKQTLQSIIDNYEGAELRAIAQERLNAIILSEAADTQLDEEEEPMEIDM